VGQVWHGLTTLQDETERFALDKRQALIEGLVCSPENAMSKSYYVTTPIYYVNGPPHIATPTPRSRPTCWRAGSGSTATTCST